MELHRSVGQVSRNGPFPRVPPAISICPPTIILPQTRQKRLSSSECHSRNWSSRRSISSLSGSGNLLGGEELMRKHIHPRRLTEQSGARRIYPSVKTLWRCYALARSS